MDGTCKRNGIPPYLFPNLMRRYGLWCITSLSGQGRSTSLSLDRGGLIRTEDYPPDPFGRLCTKWGLIVVMPPTGDDSYAMALNQQRMGVQWSRCIHSWCYCRLAIHEKNAKSDSKVRRTFRELSSRWRHKDRWQE